MIGIAFAGLQVNLRFLSDLQIVTGKTCFVAYKVLQSGIADPRSYRRLSRNVKRSQKPSELVVWRTQHKMRKTVSWRRVKNGTLQTLKVTAAFPLPYQTTARINAVVQREEVTNRIMLLVRHCRGARLRKGRRDMKLQPLAEGRTRQSMMKLVIRKEAEVDTLDVLLTRERTVLIPSFTTRTHRAQSENPGRGP